MPGVFICPIHKDATVESNVSADELKYGFSPLLPETQGSSAPTYEQEIAAKLFDYSCDIAWLAQHGQLRRMSLDKAYSSAQQQFSASAVSSSANALSLRLG